MDQKNYFISAFGTFGNPNGFRQSFFFLDNSHSIIARNLATFDLNTVAIKILPKSKVYSIRKEFINNSTIFSYAIYSFAKEQNSERGGTFIGSSIIYKEKIGNENITVSVLEEFHTNLLAKFVENDTITVNHSDKFSVNKPKDFDKIGVNLTDVLINLNLFHTNKILFVFCDTSPEKLQIFLKKSVDLLNVYDTIYFTRSEEVATFVAQKGIFKFIQQVGDKKEFDQEIENLEAERKEKRTDAIAKFEKNKLQFEEEKNREIESRKKQIEQNQQKQSENQKKIDGSKSDLSKLVNLYKTFAGNISVLMSGLHSGRNLDEVNNSYKQFEKEFIDEKRKLGSPNEIALFSNHRTNSGNLTPQTNQKTYDYDSGKGEKISKFDLFKFISVILNVLLISSVILYFAVFNTTPSIKISEQSIPIYTENTNIEPADSLLEKISPTPDTILNRNDYRIVNKKIENNTKIDEVITVIFQNNPSGIKKHYENQKRGYKELLYKRNSNAFEITIDNTSHDTIFTGKDSLKIIPSMKNK